MVLLKNIDPFVLITSAVQLVAFIVSLRYDLNGKKGENGVRTGRFRMNNAVAMRRPLTLPRLMA